MNSSMDKVKRGFKLVAKILTTPNSELREADLSVIKTYCKEVATLAGVFTKMKADVKKAEDTKMKADVKKAEEAKEKAVKEKAEAKEKSTNTDIDTPDIADGPNPDEQ